MINMSEASSTRKNRPGRAYRKRRKKLLDIQLAAEEAIRRFQHPEQPQGRPLSEDTAVETTKESSHSSLPSDRDKVWPSVLELRKQLGNWNTDDEAALVSQLGYLPGNAVQVTARERDIAALATSNNKRDGSVPVAIELYPVALRHETDATASKRKRGRKRRRNSATCGAATDDNDVVVEPFPTIYWLTHPLLRILISKLEVTGLGSEIEDRLQKEADAAGQMTLAHAKYGQQRHNLLAESDMKGIVHSKGWLESALSRKRGVAGIRNTPFAVKCLHAHAAHFVSQTHTNGGRYNVVGRWVMERVEQLVNE